MSSGESHKNYILLVSLLYCSPIYALVSVDHVVEREVCLDVGATARAGDIVQVIYKSGGVRAFALLHQEAGFAVADNLFRRAAPVCDNGRTSGHRFDGG